MSKKKSPDYFGDLTGEFSQICRVLYDRQLLIDSNPYTKNVTGKNSYQISWSGKSKANSILFDEEKNCQIILEMLRTNRQYSLLLYDKSILQAEYIIENGILIKARLLFIKLQNKIWELEEIKEFADVPDLLDESLNEEIGLPIMFRVDYDPLNHRNCDHPRAHFVISNLKDCRIPMKAPLSLGQFVNFIFKQVYNIEIPELTKVKFEDTITPEEQTMEHINW